MRVAKQAISYYSKTTGKSWREFYNNLDNALSAEESNLTDEYWLIRKLIGTIESHGVSVAELKMNKDTIKGVFDEQERENAGEFFTPEIWCKEGRTYFDKYIPNWKEMNVWDASAGTGNLMRTANHPVDKLFISTLQEDDVELIKNTEEYKGATVFQLDFLSELDYDTINTPFLDKLPKRLQQAIRNDEGLIFYMNPPYKFGCAKLTDVGRHMSCTGFYESAYDLLHQFVWRVQKFVELYDITQVWVGLFSPLQFYTGCYANSMLREFEKCFEFIDGMCIPAKEFSDTSTTMPWGIGFTLWKSRGCYHDDNYRKDIILEMKSKLPDGSIQSSGRVLYEMPRERLTNWVSPKDVLFYKQVPAMVSHSTFKGSEPFERVATVSGKMASNALGTLMTCDTIMRSFDISAVLSMPTTVQYENITEENFWRCVSSFVYRQMAELKWEVSKNTLSAPNVTCEGYEIWLKNALVMFLFEWKSMMSSHRKIQYDGGIFTVRNHFFYISAEEIRQNCTDEVILNDIEENPPVNEFMLKAIAESEPYWDEEVREFFNFCKQYTLETLNKRKDFGYKGSLEAWDAGFQQLRAVIWDDDLQTGLAKRITKIREKLHNEAKKFGFVSYVQ